MLLLLFHKKCFSKFSFNLQANKEISLYLLEGLNWIYYFSPLVKAESSGEVHKAIRGLVSNLPHPRVIKTKQHMKMEELLGRTHWAYDALLTLAGGHRYDRALRYNRVWPRSNYICCFLSNPNDRPHWMDEMLLKHLLKYCTPHSNYVYPTLFAYICLLHDIKLHTCSTQDTCELRLDFAA